MGGGLQGDLSKESELNQSLGEREHGRAAQVPRSVLTATLVCVSEWKIK